MELRQLRGLQGVTYPERSMRLLAGWGRAAFDSRWPVCEKRTMTGSASTSAADLGRRIAQARQEADLTQAELGHAVGLDRTAIAKVETGVRKVSAAELLAIASVLDRPIDSFVFEPPPSVVSRRSDALAGSRSRLPDMRIDRLARDIAFLVDQEFSQIPRSGPA